MGEIETPHRGTLRNILSMDTVTCNISIKLDEEEMEMYSEIYAKLCMQKKPQAIIKELHSYDCLNHKIKKINEAIKIVINEMSVIKFLVISQNTESALILSVIENIK